MKKKERKICILGTADSVYKIPYDTHEIWLAGSACHKSLNFDRVDKIFEIHNSKIVKHNLETHDYNKYNCPVYMQYNEPLIDSFVHFPHCDIVDNFQTDYFTNSISWMIAYAIMLNVTEIVILGVHLDNISEYKWERPCVEYWIGKAESLNINVILPKDSFLKHKHFLYGYESSPDYWEKIASKRKFCERMIKESMANYMDALQKAAIIKSQKHLMDTLFRTLEHDSNILGVLKTITADVDINFKNIDIYNQQMVEQKELFDRYFGANLMLDLLGERSTV